MKRRRCCLCSKNALRTVPTNITILGTEKSNATPLLCNTHYNNINNFKNTHHISNPVTIEIQKQPKGVKDIISIVTDKFGQCKHSDNKCCSNCKEGNTRCKGISFEKVSHLLTVSGIISHNGHSFGSVNFNHHGEFCFFSVDCNNCNLNKYGVCEKCYECYETKLRHYQRTIENQNTKTAHLAARTQEYKNVIKSLKAKISRRDTTIKNFEELIEEKDQKHYLIELLSIALEEGKLHETQFFYQLLENTLQNLVSSKNVNGFRYKECIIHWCLLLRFYGGSCLWNILKGNSPGETITSENALDKLNLLLPSISTIKSYLPDLSFGNLVDSDLKDIVKAMALNNISNKIIISYDEIEIRGGLCVMKSTGKVIGFTNCNEKSFEDIYNAKREITPDDIASHVCQFFATTIDGEMSFPICFGGHKSNHYEFTTKKMTEIRDQFKRTSYGDYVLEVVGGCIDGLAGNYQYATMNDVQTGMRKNN
ncbi:hypothetical protein FDP41_000548 [Naegleria fowleri]|uniref:Uncharacterized protein n=1 Tax=Naegleria fowleri TaxID=5763 RepID=A0A6A5CH80_NAEFO|nr:uncharacterized protein FDP41_000548 [Naegleria fowleri]KAF0984649.1 hypothetical protein FDP41_000548 [Naegleria fowleri]